MYYFQAFKRALLFLLFPTFLLGSYFSLFFLKEPYYPYFFLKLVLEIIEKF